jgi:hypothetical protein
MAAGIIIEVAFGLIVKSLLENVKMLTVAGYRLPIVRGGLYCPEVDSSYISTKRFWMAKRDNSALLRRLSFFSSLIR